MGPTKTYSQQNKPEIMLKTCRNIKRPTWDQQKTCSQQNKSERQIMLKTTNTLIA